MPIIIRLMRAVSGEVSHGTDSSPVRTRTWFSSPYWSLNSHFHTTAIAATLVMPGRNRASRAQRSPRRDPWVRSARARATAIAAGTCSVNSAVFPIAGPPIAVREQRRIVVESEEEGRGVDEAPFVQRDP